MEPPLTQLSVGDQIGVPGMVASTTSTRKGITVPLHLVVGINSNSDERDQSFVSTVAINILVKEDITVVFE